jgi:electron transport complex protein RnfC
LGFLHKKTFNGGVHPPEQKGATAKKAIETLPIPPEVVIPLQQHIGAPAKPLVEPGTAVQVGDLIAEAGGFVSLPVHASISGTVSAVEERPHPLGGQVLSVVIQGDGQDQWNPSIGYDANYLDLTVKETVERIQQAGVAGMGGATFPTHVKLSPPADKPIDTLIINGAECEPYLTSDHRLLLEEPQKILLGIQILAKVLSAKKVAIGIEDNKADAIKVMRGLISKLKLPFSVHALPVKYPQGAEKQLIKAVVNRTVPAGSLPMTVGCVVQNVATAAAIHDAVAFRRPVVQRVVTVSGNAVQTAKNCVVRLGTSYRFILQECGGVNGSLGKVIMGGPMMGFAQSSLDLPVIKGTSGLLFLDARQARRNQETVCISCARCIDVCPMRLMPKMLGAWVRHKRIDKAIDYHILDCMECGSCAFVCPAHIDLLHLIRYGKSEAIKKRKKAS